MQRKVPMRKCLGCFEMKPKKELIRVVKSKDNVISVDLSGKLNGRGAYICHSKDCLDKAFKRKQLERAFEMPISDEIFEQLMEQLGDTNE